MRSEEEIRAILKAINKCTMQGIDVCKKCPASSFCKTGYPNDVYPTDVLEWVLGE